MINYDLALMALEGMGRSRLTVKNEAGEIRIEAKSQGFKELARLCLLLGSADVAEGEEFELTPGIHLEGGSPKLRLTLVAEEVD